CSRQGDEALAEGRPVRGGGRVAMPDKPRVETFVNIEPISEAEKAHYDGAQDSPAMNEQRAREILGRRISNERLLTGTMSHEVGEDLKHVYVSWQPGETIVLLDGDATADQLEA